MTVNFDLPRESEDYQDDRPAFVQYKIPFD